MKRLSTLVILLLLAASMDAVRMGIGASGGASIDSPDPADALASLYAAVPRGGYISVVSTSLTDPRVVVELVRAKKRGVNVRIIADRQRLADKRDEVALYNLKYHGIPVKVNIRRVPITLRVSIINDAYVAAGTYDYSPRRTPDRILAVTAASDNDLLQTYKGVFDLMWDDEGSYKMLEPMDVVRVMGLSGAYFDCPDLRRKRAGGEQPAQRQNLEKGEKRE